MAFKPYCRECGTWHTESEGHVAITHPGTLTLTIGDRSIVLDPLDPRPKFNAVKATIEEALTELDIANHAQKHP